MWKPCFVFMLDIDFPSSVRLLPHSWSGVKKKRKIILNGFAHDFHLRPTHTVWELANGTQPQNQRKSSFYFACFCCCYLVCFYCVREQHFIVYVLIFFSTISKTVAISRTILIVRKTKKKAKWEKIERTNTFFYIFSAVLHFATAKQFSMPY